MTAVRGYQLLIDWSDQGTYANTLEDVTRYVDKGPVTCGWGRGGDGGTSLSAPTAELAFTLRNRDSTGERWFSPENTSSPINGRIYPGRATRLHGTVPAGGTLATESWPVSTSGWTAPNGGTLTRVATPTVDGDGSLQYVPPGAIATVNVQRGTPVAMVRPDAPHVFSFTIRSSAGWADVVPCADWLDAAGAFISTGGLGAPQTLTAGTWTAIQSAPLTPPANAVSARPRLRLGSTPPNTNTFNVDNHAVTYAPVDAGSTYVMHAGVLDKLAVDPNSVARTFTGHSLDGWGRPGTDRLSTPLYSGIRTGTAVGLVLDAVGWTGPRAIDPGASVLPWWWEEGTDAGAAIDGLVNAEGPPAIAYVEGGTFVFRDRHHRILDPRSLSSQGTFTHIVPAGSGPGRDYKVETGSFQYDHGTDYIANTASFAVDVRQPRATQEVWSSDDLTAMTVGDVQVVYAQPSDPVLNAIAPVVDTDLLSQSGSFTASIDRTSGESIAITVTCTGTGIITRLALRASPVPVVRSAKVSSADHSSIGRYGTQNWPESLPWANVYDAQAIADRIVALYAGNRPRVVFSIVGTSDYVMAKIFGLRISDRITVRNDVLGLNQDLYVERLDHTVERLQIHRLTVTCVVVEPVQPTNVLSFNAVGKGFDDGLFGIDGLDNPATVFIFDKAGQGFDQGFFGH